MLVVFVSLLVATLPQIPTGTDRDLVLGEAVNVMLLLLFLLSAVPVPATWNWFSEAAKAVEFGVGA
jgi:hypothetical protein